VFLQSLPPQTSRQHARWPLGLKMKGRCILNVWTKFQPLVVNPSQIPFWIVINQSVFTDEANRDNEGMGIQVFSIRMLSLISCTVVDKVGREISAGRGEHAVSSILWLRATPSRPCSLI